MTIVVIKSIGVAVGAGWQSVVAYVNVTSYYLIGIPLGAVLGYVVGFQVKVIYRVRCLPLWNSRKMLALNPCSPWLFIVGHLDWHAARNTSPNYCASVHNIKDRLG